MSNHRTLVFCVLLLVFPLLVLGQVHIDAIEQAVTKHAEQDPEDFAKILFNAFVQDMFVNNFMENLNDTCWEDFFSLSNYSQGLEVIGRQTLALNRLVVALDSFGKPRAGIFKGDTKLMGDYDECLSVKTSDLDITMQYCNLPITITLSGIPIPLSFAEAVCIPTSCSLKDFNATLPMINKFLSQHSAIISMNDLAVCTPQGSAKYSAGAIIMFMICFLFLFLSLSATLVDLIQAYLSQKQQSDTISTGIINSDQHATDTDSLLLNLRKKPSRLQILISDLIKGFSLYTTIPTLISTSQPAAAITSINGMRVISMFWIIMCHTYFFSFEFQSFANSMFVYTDFVSRFASQPILNGFFAVDSFFFLSGLLVAYLTFRQMQRSKGRFPYLPFYIHRILRLTPTYMFVLFFYWFVTVHLGSGPMLRNSVGPGSHADKICRSYWWTNLLYINNFYPSKFMDECMGWAWYLANDMQFYVISPLLLIPLYHWMPVGLISAGVTLLLSFGVTGFIAGYYKYSVNSFHFMVDTSYVPPAGQPDQSSQIYSKPYCRIAPYIVGIVLGYILFKKYVIPAKKNIIGILVYGVIWSLAIIFGMCAVYGIYSDWHGHKFTMAETVLYYMFARFTWGLALFLVVFACHNGYGGVINRFLSLPIWVPLGRLTFNAYLVHEIVMILIFSDLRTPLYYTDMNFILYIIGAIALAYGASAVVTVFVEFPLSNVEMAVFKALGAPLRSSRQDKPEPGAVRSQSPLDTKPQVS